MDVKNYERGTGRPLIFRAEKSISKGGCLSQFCFAPILAMESGEETGERKDDWG